jgi:hypothetical protein
VKKAMFSLRKRFKSVLENNESERKEFDQLPIELYFCIIDHLTTKDILNLRLLNSKFKQIIDSARFIWSKRVKLHIQINKNFKLNSMLNFLTNIKTNSIEIDCLKQIKLKNLQSWSNSFEQEERDLKINFKVLNTMSIHYLNVFSENCIYLKIESFVNTFGQFKSSSQLNHYTTRTCSKLKHLNISCLLYDLNQEKYYIWNDIYLENFFRNQFKQTFTNIQELELNFYHSSTRLLIRNLKKLKFLKTLYLYECQTINDYNKAVINDSSLLISELNLTKCSTWLVINVLEQLINPNEIKILKLFLLDKDLNNHHLIKKILENYLKLISLELNF